MKTRNLCQSLKLLFVLAILVMNLAVSAQGLKASGKKIVNQYNSEVILRGMGLGGWMLQEPYMMEMTGFAGTQWQIKAKIEALIGTANTQKFYDAWHANHCTRADIDSMSAWGFNSVRLPMHYNLYTLPVENEPVSGQNTWLEKGFVMTDSLINWCKANHMYVILDLHAAPGAQGKDAAISDGDPAKPSLWDSEANKKKTIALWRKLAERYVDEPWVGAYDLINEPNWSFTASGNQNGCSENSNAPLMQLYKDITTAIRQVDTKHLIIIEGNCWGNNYNGITPTWDNNMALSFHKYWSNNDQGSIQGIINLRNQYNIPIWLGESGENSNTWFTDALQLVEKNGIGWAWWPLKKINSIVGPLTIVKTPEYQVLLNYWNNTGSQPTVSFATSALMQMAENAKIQNCIFRKDVIDAMFRQVQDSTTLPFISHTIPGVISAVDYDLGRNGKAYMDTDNADYHVSSGSYTNWNSGNTYRNDGVDIGTSYDPEVATTINYIGWTADGEWLQYTTDVDSTASYTIAVKFANLNAGSNIRLMVNDGDVSGLLSLPATGGYNSWSNFAVNDVILYKGRKKIKVIFEKGGANLGYLKFTLQKKTEDVTLKPVSAETFGESERIFLSFNKILVDTSVIAGNFSCTVNGNAVTIASLSVNPSNPAQISIDLSEQIFDIDVITLNYTGTQLSATDGTLLQNFSNLPVKNNLPVNIQIPGKIEAEAFSVNNGLVLETTSDTGGGKNLGYTNSGDYLDYKVRVVKSSKYNIEVRAACFNAAGRIEIQQINSSGTVINTVQIGIPVTGGWQTWQTITSSMNLTEGVSTIRVKILQPEFNLNWFRFTDNSFGIEENETTVFSLFPNPATNEVSVFVPDALGTKKTISLWSCSGSLVRIIKFSESEIIKKFSVSGLPEGLYMVEVKMNGLTIRRKLIIQ